MLFEQLKKLEDNFEYYCRYNYMICDVEYYKLYDCMKSIFQEFDISKKDYNLLKTLLPKVSYDFEFDMLKDALKMIDNIIEVRNKNIEQLNNHPLPEPMKLNLELLSTEPPQTDFDKYKNIRKSNLKALKNYTLKYNNTNNIN